MAEMTIKGNKLTEEPEGRFRNFLRNFQWFDNSQQQGPGFLSGLGTTLMAGGAGFAGSPDKAMAILQAQQDRFNPDIETEYKKWQMLQPREWKPATMEEAVKFEKKKSELKPQNSPLLENAKNKRLESLITTIEDSNVKRASLSEALDAAKRIDSGVYGTLKRGFLKTIGADSPVLSDWQKVKIVLTDAQLMNTAKTKGAISDKEMALFSKAAANDDVASVRAMMPVFNRILKTVNADEQSKAKSWKRLYGEDPYEALGIQSNISDVSGKPLSGKTSTGIGYKIISE